MPTCRQGSQSQLQILTAKLFNLAMLCQKHCCFLPFAGKLFHCKKEHLCLANFYRLLNWPSSANSNYTDWSEQISIVFLYEHIANITGSDSCIKKYTIQLCSPVCAINSYSSNFGYNKQHMQLVLYRLDQLISSTRLYGHKHIMCVAQIRNLGLSTTN